MADQTPSTQKTVTLPLVWKDGHCGDTTLYVADTKAGEVVWATDEWWAIRSEFLRWGKTIHPSRSAALTALEQAVLAMGIEHPDAADAARFRWLVENRERTWESTLRTDLRFSREIAWEARADDVDTSIRDLIDADMAREKNDAT